MVSKNKIINLIKVEKPFLKESFGVLKIGLFGSYAKERQTSESDLEKKIDRKIEIIRKRTLETTKFFERIEQKIIYV